MNKLRDMLALEDQQTAKNIHKSLADEAREKLTASRFRYLNEQLYTQPSNAAVIGNMEGWEGCVQIAVTSAARSRKSPLVFG